MAKLYEFRAKSMALLLRYEPKSPQEKEIIDVMMQKLNNLNSHDLPKLIDKVEEYKRRADVSDDLKSILQKIVEMVSIIQT